MDTLLVCLTCAGVGSAVASPLVGILDKAVVENSANVRGLRESIILSLRSILSHPFRFVKSPVFTYTWLSYLSTYGTANYCDRTLLRDKHKLNEMEIAKRETVKLSGVVFAANVTMITRDQSFAKMFGAYVGAESSMHRRKVPLITYGVWVVRSIPVNSAALVLPPYLFAYLRPRIAKESLNDSQLRIIGQIGLVGTGNVLSTWFHLLGLDYYNNPHFNRKQRTANIRRLFLPTVATNLVRGISPFVIGPMINAWCMRHFDSLAVGV